MALVLAVLLIACACVVGRGGGDGNSVREQVRCRQRVRSVGRPGGLLGNVAAARNDDGDFWKVCPDQLDPRTAVVYSFGLSRDFSLEIGLVRELAVREVHSFDPTDEARAFFARQLRLGTMPPEITFHAMALGPVDGNIRLRGTAARGGADSAQSKKLRTIMRELGHSYVDLIKLDIGGAEWSVLEGLVGQRSASGAGPLPFGQLLVEFHRLDRPVHQEALERLVGSLAQLGLEPFSVGALHGGGEGRQRTLGFTWAARDSRPPLAEARDAALRQGAAADAARAVQAPPPTAPPSKYGHNWAAGSWDVPLPANGRDSRRPAVETVWDRDKKKEKEKVRLEGQQLRVQQADQAARFFAQRAGGNGTAPGPLGYSDLAHPRFVQMLPSVSGAHLIRERRY